VKEYLDRAAAAGLSWEIAAGLSEEELDRRLFAAADTRQPDRPLPDWEAVEKELTISDVSALATAISAWRAAHVSRADRRLVPRNGTPLRSTGSG
jgi:transposase